MEESKKTIEEQLKEIAEVTQKLENGGLSLEEALKEYEKGVKLVREAGAALGEAEKQLISLTEGEEDV